MWRLLVSCVSLAVACLSAAAQPIFPTPEPPNAKAVEEPFGDPALGRPLPPGAIARLGSPRMRTRKNYSSGLQFSVSGRWLIVAGGQDDLWWYAPATGKTLHRHEYPVGNIKGGRLLDDGQLLLFHRRTTHGGKAEDGKGDKEEADFVLRFDPVTGKTVSDVKLASTVFDERRSEPRIGDVAFDARGASVVSLRDHVLAVYDLKTGAERWTKTLDAKPEHVPCFLADGSKLLVLARGKLAVHDAKTGAAAGTLEAGGGDKDEKDAEGYEGVVESADGKWLAAAGPRETVVVWNAATGKITHRFGKQKKPIGFDPAGRLFLAGPEDLLVIWDSATNQRDGPFPLPSADKAALAPDGKRLATPAHDAVVVYDVPARGEPTLAAVSADVPGLPDELRFEADGSLVGRLSGWGGWVVWTDRKPEPQLVRPAGTDAVVGISADRQRVLRLRDNEFLVSGLTGHAPAAFKYELSNSDVKNAAALSADGATAVAAHNEGLTRFDLATRTAQVIRSPFKDRGAGNVAALSADGRVAAVEGYDPVTDARYVEAFSLATNLPIRNVPIRGVAERLLLTPDGRRLAIAFVANNARGEPEKSLMVLDPVTGLELLKLGPMAKGDGVHVALAPDGRTVAWHASSELRVYELVSGQQRAKVTTPRNDLHSAALAADGRTLAVAAPGWPVVLWDIAGEAKFKPLLAANEWDATWAALGKPDAAAAYHAARRMALTPDDAAAFLKKRLTPAVPPDPGVLAKWVNKLDAPAFADREAAAKELRGLGELAIPELTRVLEATESAEVRERIESLLSVVSKPTPEATRGVRAVEALEWLGTADARATLKALAAGAEGSRQTQEARAALARMK